MRVDNKRNDAKMNERKRRGKKSTMQMMMNASRGEKDENKNSERERERNRRVKLFKCNRRNRFGCKECGGKWKWVIASVSVRCTSCIGLTFISHLHDDDEKQEDRTERKKELTKRRDTAENGAIRRKNYVALNEVEHSTAQKRKSYSNSKIWSFFFHRLAWSLNAHTFFHHDSFNINRCKFDSNFNFVCIFWLGWRKKKNEFFEFKMRKILRP